MKPYHFHIYYDLSDKTDTEVATELYAALKKEQELDVFLDSGAGELEIGRMYAYPIGPHPIPQFQVKVGYRSSFTWLYEYLLEHREELSVLIHPVIEDELKAHTEYAVWMGRVQDLDLTKL